MKKHNKTIALALALVFCFMLVISGCASGNVSSKPSSSAPAASAGGNTPQSPGGSGGSDKTSFKIGFVAPLTGPLANFTVGVKHAADLALAVMNKDGGITVKELNKKLPVEIVWGDSESSPTKASEVATKLATSDKVDILVGEWTPDTANPVSVVGERYKIPALVSGAPDTSWLANGPYTWSYALMFNYDYFLDEYFNGFDRLETSKKIGLILDSSVDGTGMAQFITQKAPDRGYTIVDPGRFPQGTTDYTSIISKIQSEGCDILVASLITPELVTMWNQFQQLGFKPKIAVLSKGMHLSADVKALGPTAAGNCIETQWSPEFPFKSSLLGMTAAELSKDFVDNVKQAPDVTIGWDYSLFDVIYDVLTRAQSVNNETIRQAFAATDLNCIYGHITFQENHVGYVPICFGQWVPDPTAISGYRKALIAANHVPEVKITEQLLPKTY
jgi:branched-chain amino acid transport system substrate-binding protein